MGWVPGLICLIEEMDVMGALASRFLRHWQQMQLAADVWACGHVWPHVHTRWHKYVSTASTHVHARKVFIKERGRFWVDKCSWGFGIWWQTEKLKTYFVLLCLNSVYTQEWKDAIITNPAKARLNKGCWQSQPVWHARTQAERRQKAKTKFSSKVGETRLLNTAARL